jgi:HEAT repeat protein
MAEQPEPLRERNGSTAIAAETEILKHIEELYSEDFAVRAESIHELEKFGKPAAEAIVTSLLRKSPQLSSLISFSEALEQIGKPSEEVLVHALGHITEVRSPGEVYVLQSFVETLGRLGDKRVAPLLAQQLDKLNRAINRNHNKPLVEACTAVRVRIQLILSDLGSREGLSDLLAMLGDGRRRVRDGVVESLGAIGDARALVPLIRLYAVEDDVSFANAEDIRDAFREIMRRERIAPDDKIFRDLNAQERATLEKLLPKPRKA